MVAREDEARRREELKEIRRTLETELTALRKREKKARDLRAGEIAELREKQARIEKKLDGNQKKLDVLERLEKADFGLEQIPLMQREVEMLEKDLEEIRKTRPAKFLEKMKHKADIARAKKKLEQAKDKLGEYKGLVSWAENYRRQWG